jgi:hypothetical protein
VQLLRGPLGVAPLCSGGHHRRHLAILPHRDNATAFPRDGLRWLSHGCSPLAPLSTPVAIRPPCRNRCAGPWGWASANAFSPSAPIWWTVSRALLVISMPHCRMTTRASFGAAHRHWRRARFFPQVRLFSRFHSRSRLMVLGWVNDTNTKRAYGSKTVAYRVCQSMLASGQRPAASRRTTGKSSCKTHAGDGALAAAQRSSALSRRARQRRRRQTGRHTV